jgi:hypothetical protein
VITDWENQKEISQKVKNLQIEFTGKKSYCVGQ